MECRQARGEKSSVFRWLQVVAVGWLGCCLRIRAPAREMAGADSLAGPGNFIRQSTTKSEVPVPKTRVNGTTGGSTTGHLHVPVLRGRLSFRAAHVTAGTSTSASVGSARVGR